MSLNNINRYVMIITTWCETCKLLREKIGRIEGAPVVEEKDASSDPSIFTNFNIKSVPTILIMNSGKEVDRLVGNAPIAEVEAFLKK